MDRQELQKLIVGAICPLPTPFDDDFRVDNGRMYELCSYLIDQGLATGNSMLKVASAVGEGSSLGDDEWPSLLRTVVRAADGKCPVMHSIHHKDTFRSIEDAKKAADLGAVGLQVSPPLFSDPNQDDMLRYFEALSDAIEIGVMIYNQPWYSRDWAGSVYSLGNIEPDTFVGMADFEHIVAVKWSVPEGTPYEEMSKFAGTFNVIDNNTDPILCHKLGGRGYIGFDPVFPKRELKIWELLESGQYDEAQRLKGLDPHAGVPRVRRKSHEEIRRNLSGREGHMGGRGMAHGIHAAAFTSAHPGGAGRATRTLERLAGANRQRSCGRLVPLSRIETLWDTRSVDSGQALRLPVLRQAQDRCRGFAPLHTPYFISLHRTSAPATLAALESLEATLCTALRYLPRLR